MMKLQDKIGKESSVSNLRKNNLLHRPESMIDEEFSSELMRKHSFLSKRESVDWLTVECPPRI